MLRISFAVPALFLFAPLALAQPQPGGGVGQRPAGGSYLNLLGGSGNPGLNYLGVVRPQQQLQQQFGQLQQQANLQNQQLTQAYDQQLGTLTNALLPPTGNVSVFNNLGGYFGRIPMGNGSGGGGLGTSRFGGGGGMGGGGGAGGLSRPAFAGGSGAGGLSRPSGGGRR